MSPAMPYILETDAFASEDAHEAEAECSESS